MYSRNIVYNVRRPGNPFQYNSNKNGLFQCDIATLTTRSLITGVNQSDASHWPAARTTQPVIWTTNADASIAVNVSGIKLARENVIRSFLIINISYSVVFREVADVPLPPLAEHWSCCSNKYPCNYLVRGNSI